MSDKTLEVYKALREGQNKYTYFLLAAAGAAIALTINQTQAAKLSWSQIPLAISVICWALSFFFGCRHLAYINSILYANGELLDVESGNHPEVGSHPQMIKTASEGIQISIKTNSNHANNFGHLQFRVLILGAFFYMGWHILEMYLRGIIKP
jgi:hypothetical protein